MLVCTYRISRVLYVDASKSILAQMGWCHETCNFSECCIRHHVIHASAHNVVSSHYSFFHVIKRLPTWMPMQLLGVALHTTLFIGARIACDVHVDEACVRTCRWGMPWPMGQCLADSLTGTYQFSTNCNMKIMPACNSVDRPRMSPDFYFIEVLARIKVGSRI